MSVISCPLILKRYSVRRNDGRMVYVKILTIEGVMISKDLILIQRSVENIEIFVSDIG